MKRSKKWKAILQQKSNKQIAMVKTLSNTNLSVYKNYRRLLSLCFFIFIYTNLFGQEQKDEFSISQRNKSINHKLHQDRLHFFDLKNIENRTSANRIRIWNSTSCIEVINSNDSSKGKIYFAIQNVNNENEFLRKVIDLNQSQANQIYELLLQYKIDKPSEEQNEINTEPELTKNETLDGETITIETSFQNKYSLISYNSSTIYRTDEEGKTMRLKDDTNKILNIDAEFKTFIDSNKFYCYRYYGASYTVCTILTKKEAKKQKIITKTIFTKKKPTK